MRKSNDSIQLPFSFSGSPQPSPRRRGSAQRGNNVELVTHSKKSKKKPPKKKEPFAVRSVTLTAPQMKTLEQIGLDASDALGWKVSRSAVMRAFLVHAEQQGPEWIAQTIHPLIERELEGGVVWGHRGK
jgi:hypothetical protein